MSTDNLDTNPFDTGSTFSINLDEITKFQSILTAQVAVVKDYLSVMELYDTKTTNLDDLIIHVSSSTSDLIVSVNALLSQALQNMTGIEVSLVDGEGDILPKDNGFLTHTLNWRELDQEYTEENDEDDD